MVTIERSFLFVDEEQTAILITLNANISEMTGNLQLSREEERKK
jgi:hypothetical protein